MTRRPLPHASARLPSEFQHSMAIDPVSLRMTKIPSAPTPVLRQQRATASKLKLDGTELVASSRTTKSFPAPWALKKFRT